VKISINALKTKAKKFPQNLIKSWDVTASSRALVAKAFRHGFYWPIAQKDAKPLVK
jgi:hypothetical protein